MDSIFKMIDRLLTNIPENVQRMIRIGALGLWVLAAIVVGYWAYAKGKASVPQTGDDLYLSNIKEKLYRDRMKQNPAEVTLPDLNELTQQETAPLSVFQSDQPPPESTKNQPDIEPLPLQGEDDSILYPNQNPLKNKNSAIDNNSFKTEQPLKRDDPSNNKEAPLPFIN